MINNDRRKFIFKSGALVASTALTACGGGGGATASGVAAAAPVAPVTSAPVTDDTPAGASQLAATAVNGTPVAGASFRLVGATTVKAAPFCLGYAFRKGDVPAGSTVTNATGTLQVTPKNTWPDGSLKFAILAGQADVTGGTDTVVALQTIPAPAAPTPLATAKLRATEIVAEIGCGAYGTASWSGADWDAPFQTWVAGNRMSSWIYRKPVGSDPHLVAWLEVRLWASGAVEVLPWIENGYLNVAAPTNKSATFTFSLAKTQRMSAAIDLKHHQRTPLINGTALSYWLSIDPGVTARHDTAYLQASELVPTYMAKVDSSAGVVSALVSSFVPLQAGNFNYDGDSMAATGYQDPIGMLPMHDVLYLTSNAPNAFAAVVRNGFSAGRYGIHYRDETTNRPLRFSKYPTLNIGDGQGFKDSGGSTTGSYVPKPSGGIPPNWDPAHSPSVGYLAYLITGRWYFMEEVQFATTVNYLGNGDNSELRTGSKGLVQTCTDCWQTRASAWDWRARVQALCVTPDADTDLRAEFIASVEANIDHFYGRYVAQPNNPFGWVKPGETYNGSIGGGAPWQQDFVTAAFGFAVSVGLPISTAASSKLAAFFQWKAKSAVMRLGSRDGFWYVNATPYTMQISPSSAPDYNGGTGPWYSNDAAVYAATYAVPPSWFGSLEGTLAGEIMPGDRAMWGNLMPAIAYAVRHNVPGAKAAYDRLLQASNWSSLRAAFNNFPVWSVAPLGYSDAQPAIAAPIDQTLTNAPAWLAGKAVGEWVEIAGTAGAGGAALDAFSGFAFNPVKNEIMIAAAGGHTDSSDNRVVSLQLMTNTPMWQLRSGASSAPAPDVAYYPDGKPSSRHLYSTAHFVPQVNRLMLFGERFAYGNAYTFAAVAAFNPDTNTWDKAGSWADMPSGHYGSVMVNATGEVYSNGLARWSPVTKSWSQPVTRTADLVRWPIAHDSLRNQLFTLNWGDGEGYGTPAVYATRVPLATGVQASVTFNPSAALTSFIADTPSYAGMDYDSVNDRFMFYCGQGAGAGRVYVVKPNAGNVWDISILPLATSKLPPATPVNGVHNRFRYVAALKGFVMLPSGGSNLFFIRTA
jgi:hypothetical protein